jgi:hypothetical protein
MIDWADPLPPMAELHAEAQAISRIVELREARVGIKYDLWWIEREMQLAVASLRQE